MIPINWKAFAKRFDGCEQGQFEKMALLHFCHCFGMPQGVFRYVNHPNVETEPVNEGADVLAFQAKYYSDKISSHKQELINAITGAKEHYPQLNKLLFYLNQDHTCNTQGGKLKAAYQSEIEDHAKRLGVSLIWMTKSRLEVMLSQPDCEFIARYFFAENEGLPELVRALEERTLDQLNSIRDEFGKVDGIAVPSVDRKEEIAWLKYARSGEVSILSGVGGVGKSATVKLFWRQLTQTDRLAYLHLDAHSALQFLSVEALSSGWNLGLDHLLAIYEGLDQRWLVIDSMEHLEGCPRLVELMAVMRKFQRSGWRIVLTTRGLYENSLLDSLADADVRPSRTRHIRPLSTEQVGKVLSAFEVQAHHWRSIESALQIPFNLNLYLRHGLGKSPMATLEAWRTAVWAYAVEGGTSCISCGETFCELIRQKLAPGFKRFNVTSLRAEDIDALCRRGVLVRQGTGHLSVGHDIYEEWALVRILNEQFEDFGDVFPSCLETALPTRRAFRLWVYDRLGTGHADDGFVKRMLAADMGVWREETVQALLQWVHLGDFLTRNSDWFLANGASELIALLNVVQIVGKARRTKLAELGLEVNPSSTFSYFYTAPAGVGWHDLVCFIARHVDAVVESSYGIVIGVLDSFAQSCREGDAAQAVNHSALHFARTCDKRESVVSYRLYKPIASILSSTVNANREEVGGYLKESLAIADWQDLDFFGSFAEQIVRESPLHAKLIEMFPRECEMIFAGVVSCRPSKSPVFDFGYVSRAEKFGLREDVDSIVQVGSAFATPSFYLLKSGGQPSCDFLLGMLNRFFDKYCGERHKVEFFLPDGEKVSLYEGLDLWSAHRVLVGPLLPHVIVCILMALEKFALSLASTASADNAEDWCLNLMGKSNNVSIPGLLSSVVLKNKWKFMRLAMTLFSCREAFALDLKRAAIEETNGDNYYGRKDPCASLYRYEREEAKKEKFRKESLELLLFNYQMVREGVAGEMERVNRIWSLLDSFYGKYKKLPPEELCFRSRVDIRMVKRWERRDDGKGNVGFVPIPCENEEVKKLQQDNDRRQRPMNIGLGLKLWASSVLQPELVANDQSAAISAYKSDLHRVIKDLDELRSLKPEGGDDFLTRSVVVEASAALLKTWHLQLDDSQLMDYKGVVLSALAETYWKQRLSMTLASRDKLLSAMLVVMAETANEEVRTDIRVALLLFLIADFPAEGMGAKSAFAVVQSSKLSASVRLQLACDYVRLKKTYCDFLEKARDAQRTVRDFIANDDGQVASITDSPSTSWKDVEPLLKGEALCGAVVLVAGSQANAENVDFLLACLPRALAYLYTPNTDGEVRFNSVHGVRMLVLRSLSPWVLNATGDLRDKIANIFIATEHMFDTPDILDELAICAESLGANDSFTYYWGRFADMLCLAVRKPMKNRHAEELLSSYTLTAYYWRTDLNSEPSRLVDEGLLAVYKRVFDGLRENPFAVARFSLFFAAKGSAHCLVGLSWITDALKSMKRLDHDLMTSIDELMLKVQELHRADVVSDKLIYNQMLTVLDRQVAEGSSCAFQIRETL